MSRIIRIPALILAVIAVSLSSVGAQSIWEWQNPLPQGNELTAISFPDLNTGTAVGFAGTVLRTTDGGITWANQSSGTPLKLNAVHFADTNTGTAVGNSGTIIRTTDGGSTWISQASGVSITLRGVFFIDANTGFVVGSSSTILRTTDGGATWISQTSPVTAALFAVYFIDSDNGIIVGQNGTILRTTDGGVNWTSQASGTTVILRAISFTDANTGIVVGPTGTILKTTDGGVTWNTLISGTTATLTGVSFTDTSTATAVGSSGTILRTSDGGTTWVGQTSNTTNQLNAVRFFDANTGITVGGTGVTLRTTDGGTTWTNQQTLITSNNLRGVFFTDTNNGTAVGLSGTILRTTDGGTTWTSQTSPLPSASLYDVLFTDVNTGIIVGSGGTVLRTSNAGATWVDNSLAISSHLEAVAFIGPDTGYAVGSGGTIIKTVDGGANWVSQSSGTSNWLYDVSFSDVNTGTVVGDAETILRTTDGGNTWVTQNSGVFPSYEAVSFTDANTGTLVGALGVIRRTTDGGLTWDFQVSGTSNAFRDVHFFDTNNGIAVGLGGLYLTTDDGGTTWTSQAGITANNIWSISFITNNTGTVVGDGGAILKSIGLAPPPPALSLPSNGATDVSINPIFKWRPSIWATTYRLQVSSDSSFTMPIMDQSGIFDTLYSASGLDHNTTYHWRVNAANAEGTSDWSTVWSFTTIGPFSPSLISVNDVPNDQGGWVTLKWNASSLDTNVTTMPYYSIWRAIPPEMQIPEGYRQRTENSQEVAHRTKELRGESYTWEWIANQPAHRLPEYAFTAPTLYDSMATTTGMHYFFVSAHTSDPNVFYDSNVDSGYSVDNLAPHIPDSLSATVIGNAIALDWSKPIDSDFRNFAVYRDTIGGFEPTTPYALVVENAFVDSNIVSGQEFFYKISALDFAGNESGYSSEVSSMVTSITNDDSRIPKKFGLNQNYPNPFNPTTTIRYQVPRSSDVKIDIYNLLGQKVRTLLNDRREPGFYEAVWDGRNDSGVQVGSGVYIYRMTAGDYTKVRKMILVR